MTDPTKISVVKQGSTYYYTLESPEHRIEFSLSETLFDELRRAEDLASRQSEESHQDDGQSRLGIV